MSPTISVEEFKKRLEALCKRGGVDEWPTKNRDQHILMKSATFVLQPERDYSEQEVNERLAEWCDKVGQNMQIDHAGLRRYLVDGGYLERDAAGRNYRLNREPGVVMFEEDVEAVDPVAVLEEARRRVAERKRVYLRHDTS